MDKITWAPKVRQAKIWQIYQNDALGAVDEALVEDVGFSLWSRCQSILLVSSGRVECPRCGEVFKIGAGEGTESIACPTPGCGWETTAEAYHNSWRHQDLLGCNALPAFQTFFDNYPRASSVRGRMLCIDQLIHAFHWDLKLNLPNRSAAGNLIEGSHAQVVAFLDRLSFGDTTITQAQWRETAGVMMRRRNGKTSL
jgi:hypothetical protein